MSAETTQVASGRTLGDHLCWPYEGPHDLLRTTTPYLLEGLQRRERVVVVADRDLHGRLRDAGLDADHGGQLVLLTPDQAPGAGSVADGVTELARMTSDAVADGWSALRMLADVTTRVLDDRARDLYVGWEFRADHLRLEVPFTAVCAYDEQLLGADGVADLACMHPVVRGDLAPFRVVASRSADVALVGEVDVTGVDRLAATLRRADVASDAVVDARGVAYLHHRAMMALDAHAAADGRRLTLVGPPAVTDQVASLLRLDHLQVVDQL